MEPIQPFPLVFQCGRCKCIIGDSSSFQSSDENLNIIILNQSINTNVQSKTTAVKIDTLIAECQVIECSVCLKSLGRRYTNITDERYQDLNDKNTFLIPNILSYEIGTPAALRNIIPSRLKFTSDNRGDASTSSGQHASIGLGQNDNSNGFARIDEMTSPVGGGSDGGSRIKVLSNAIEGLNIEIDKIQHVLLNVIERLGVLEDRFDAYEQRFEDAVTKRRRLE